MTKQNKKPLDKKITPAHKKAVTTTPVVPQTAGPFWGDSLSLREDAERARYREAEVRAGRAWPFQTNG